MTAAAALAQLARWRAAGWLRPLDLAFARFVHELDPGAPGSLLGAAALLTHLQADGHSCLPLQGWAEEAATMLAWPSEAWADLHGLLREWPADAPSERVEWGAATTALQIDPQEDGQGNSPLVLDNSRLYLRRHWRHERAVAAQVLARCRGEGMVEDGSGTQHGAARETMGGAAGAAGTAQAGASMLAEIDKPRARALLDTLFGASTSFGNAVQPDLLAEVLIDWQKVACAIALRSRFTLITGGPGTGKTFTAARLLVLMHALHAGPQPLRVALAAPTGKAASRLKQSIDAALQTLPQPVRSALPVGAWAARLGPAQTLHRLLGTRPGTRRFAHDAAAPLDVDLIVVDEASMVHLEMMAALLQAVPAGARLVLLGDKDQLASVEAGAVLGDLCHAAVPYDEATRQWVHELAGAVLPGAAAARAGDSAHHALAQQIVTLRKGHRFDGPIGRLAEAINEGAGAQALALLQQGEGGLSLRLSADAREVALLAAGRVDEPGEPGRTGRDVPADEAGLANDTGTARPANAAGYRPYLEALRARPRDAAAFEPWLRDEVLRRFDDFRVLCALREGPWGVAGQNAAIERALAAQGLLPQRRDEWYEGRPVMVTRNDAALRIFNGDIGLVLRPPGGGDLRAYFADGEGLHSVSVARLVDVETAFALTVHKSQGSEFGHVVLVLPDADSALLTRELVYTGVTRARQALTVVVNDPARLATAAARLTKRLGGLRARL